MKMSALEYQKNTGQIDLSHLKRKKKQDEVNLEDSLTDAQLMRLAKMTAPKSLAPVDFGGKKKSNHQTSLNTIGTYEAKTTDITQSQTALQMDEEALLRELQMQISKSPHKKLIKQDDDFDISQSMSPNGKLDKQLEKIMNE